LSATPKISPKISQRSVGRLQRLLRSIHSCTHHGAAILTWAQYKQELYENGIGQNLLLLVEYRYTVADADYLPAIHDESIPKKIRLANFDRDGTLESPEGVDYLIVFMEIAIRETLAHRGNFTEDRDLAEELLASLQIDGFEFVAGKLIPATFSGIDLAREDDFLIGAIRNLKLDNMKVILNHHDEADKAYANQSWGPASSETRNFFIAVLRGLRARATQLGAPEWSSDNDKDLILNFKTIGILQEHETEVLEKLRVLLSYSGPHVGIQEQDRARLTRLLILGQAQWLLLRFAAWKKI
jgi:hypothetical protein